MLVFFNDTATTAIYTLSLHDALPILEAGAVTSLDFNGSRVEVTFELAERMRPRVTTESRASLGSVSLLDRKSTRLNSSHSQISYAVFCLKKKKKKITQYSSISMHAVD